MFFFFQMFIFLNFIKSNSKLIILNLIINFFNTNENFTKSVTKKFFFHNVFLLNVNTKLQRLTTIIFAILTTFITFFFTKNLNAIINIFF